jgi:flagellin-like protein
MKAIRIVGKRSRKAVSPVVATVILVLISVVAGVMLWLWVSGFTSAATAQQPALYERIKIEAVNVTGTTVNVTIRNVGSTTVTITSLHVLNASGILIAANNSVDTTIPPGSVGYATVSGVSYTSGYACTVRVVTKNGVEASYTFVWP